MGVIAVTGATGFIGKMLMAQLGKSDQYTLRGLSRSDSADELWRTVDYSSTASLSAALADVETVVHLAGIAHTKGVEPAAYTQAIVEHTKLLWQAFLQAKQAKVFVFASTSKVFGESSPWGSPFQPTSPCHPKSAYGQAKLAAEQYLAEQAHATGITLYTLRLPPIYGPGMKGSVRHLFSAASRRLPLPLAGIDGQHSFLSVFNLSRLLEACVQEDLPAGLLLPSDGHSWRIGDFYSALLKAFHPTRSHTTFHLPKVVNKLLKQVKPLQPLMFPFEIEDAIEYKSKVKDWKSSKSALEEVVSYLSHGHFHP